MNHRAWALDLGTTNSGVSYWDEAAGQPQLLALASICRRPDGDDPLEAPRMVPSAVEMIEDPGLLARIGKLPLVRGRLFLGRTAWIGRPALERNRDRLSPAFVPTFKRALDGEALRPMARAGRRTFTARQVARAFLRELLAEITRVSGRRPRELTATSPVGSFETYRAELGALARQLGVRRLRFLDEPVAAALGYGLTFSHARDVLVVDIGGGTMHLALVRISPAGAIAGEARVIGKRGKPLGGNAVDGWVLADLCAQTGFPLDLVADDEGTIAWRRLMLAEACRAKEAVFFRDEVVLKVVPPGMRGGGADARLPGSSLVTFTKARLAKVLDDNGFHRALEECHAALLGPGSESGLAEADVEDVLLVGGSTLLPGVYPFFEERFGRHRVRAWQPFEAVVYGAAGYAAGRFTQLDHIVHDYAFVTHDPKTGEAHHTVVVPRGTRFPTAPDLWKGQVVPTCALGEPETYFKLVICEIGQGEGKRRFVWDASGGLHKVGGAEGDGGRVIVPLNEANPALGYLDPPHQPGDRRPRLEIAFGVNEERWLVATVRDLRTRRELMRAKPVVQLL